MTSPYITADSTSATQRIVYTIRVFAIRGDFPIISIEVPASLPCPIATHAPASPTASPAPSDTADISIIQI